jgi:hypothetical protein
MQSVSGQIRVANCLTLLETPEFMRLTSTKEAGFYEFATRIWPKPNTHDTSRQVIIVRVEWGPATHKVPPYPRPSHH